MLSSLRIKALARGQSVSLFEQLMNPTQPTTSLRGAQTPGHCAPSPNRSQARYQKTRDSFSALEPAKLFRLTNPWGPRESQLSLCHSPHISCPSSSCSSYPVPCPQVQVPEWPAVTEFCLHPFQCHCVVSLYRKKLSVL